MAVTLLEELQRRHPEQFGDSVLRTLQRRVGQWRAEHGDEREIYFAQEHPPGAWGCRTSPWPTNWSISLGGLAFPHRLYQFALAHSGWRHVRVVLGGESFQSLAAGLQDALWMAGGVPEEHRTDSLSAAFNNLAEREELTKRYQALCTHYGMRPTRNNTGVSHENGAIESRQGSLKTALDQAPAAARQSRVRRPAGLRAVRGRDGASAQCPLRPGLGGRARLPEAAAGAPHGRLRGDRCTRQQVRRVHGQERALQRALAAGRASAEGTAAQHPPGRLAGRREGLRVRAAARQHGRASPPAASTGATCCPASSASPAPSRAGCCATRCSRAASTPRPGSTSAGSCPSGRRAG